MSTKLAQLLPALSLCPVLLSAQTPGPGSDQRHREDVREAYRLEDKIEAARKSYAGVEIQSPQTALPDTDKMSDVKVLDLKQIRFEPAPQAVPEASLREAAKTYLGSKVSMRDLYRMLAAMDAVYDAAGVVGRAVMPVQDIRDGSLTIQLIEARIGKVSTSNGRRFRDWYVHKAVSLNPGDPVILKPMERTLLRYNSSHESQLQAELASGSKFGETDVNLVVTEPAAYSAVAYMDNAGRDSTGELRGGLSLAAHSLLGLDESLVLNGDHAEGSDGLGLFYRMPVTKWGTFASVSYDWSEYQLIEGTAESLKVAGDDRTVTMGLNQLVWAAPTWSLSLNAGFQNSRSESRFEGLKLFAENLDVTMAGLNFNSRDKHGFWDLNQGVTRIDENDDREGTFHLYTGSLMRVQWLNEKWTVIARCAYQVSQHDMVSSRQFQIGGVATVRGFKEGILYGEDGYAATIELRRPVLQKDKLSIEGLAFIDHGAVYSGDSPTERHRQLSGAGLGANLAWGAHLSARLAYAWALKGYSDMDGLDTPDSGRLHFSVQASF